MASRTSLACVSTLISDIQFSVERQAGAEPVHQSIAAVACHIAMSHRVLRSTGPQYAEEPAKEHSHGDANTPKNQQDRESVILDPTTPTPPTPKR